MNPNKEGNCPYCGGSSFVNSKIEEIPGTRKNAGSLEFPNKEIADYYNTCSDCEKVSINKGEDGFQYQLEE